MNYSEIFNGMKLAKSYKGLSDTNPIITQHFGADPYAMEYDGRVYFYMTADAFEYDADGEIKENTYSSIRSLYVVSTDDMVNFTDHGEIMAAGSEGAAKWAHNSWAPAATWKEINGKPRFFLYFADNGGGIGVLTADSPVGPFRDPLGHALISRETPHCADVLWLFDPAVLLDDDGTGYIYFGGGVPEGHAAHPMTGRCARLGDDMISLATEPVAIDAPYLFEDSGIHKYNDTYYYTYCSNFSVDQAGTDEYGMENGEICVMESKNPLGPFIFKERILKNPGEYWTIGGNNHHCVFHFKDKWYITYHSRALEVAMGIQHNYRCTHIDEFTMGADGHIGLIEQTRDGRSQVSHMNPFEKISASTFAVMAGADTAPADEISKGCGSGNYLLSSITDGAFLKLQGLDFGNTGAASITATLKTNGKDGVIRVSRSTPEGDVLGYIPVTASDNETSICTAELKTPVTGVQDICFTFSGEGYEVIDWKFMS